MKILSVDDKSENLYMLEALLRGHGHEVDSASDGLYTFQQLFILVQRAVLGCLRLELGVAEGRCLLQLLRRYKKQLRTVRAHRAAASCGRASRESKQPDADQYRCNNSESKHVSPLMDIYCFNESPLLT